MPPLFEHQIEGQLRAVLEERLGYERGLTGANEEGNKTAAAEFESLLEQSRDREAWLRGQSNDERIRGAGAQDRLRGRGASQRAKSTGSAGASPAPTASALKKMSAAKLVAHAATLDPPLTLDEASPKGELLAAIAAHEPATGGDGDGDQAKPLDDLTEAELVAHAATLDPPLTLDEASPKDELIAAITAATEAPSS